MQSLLLRVLFIRDGAHWVAQALEHDIAAQGPSLKLARRAFERTLMGQIRLDQMQGRTPITHLPPAPSEFFDAFDQASQKTLVNEPFEAPNLPPAWLVEAIRDVPPNSDATH